MEEEDFQPYINFTPDVTGEADLQDLVNVLRYELLEDIPEEIFFRVLQALPVATAVVMQRAGADDRGRYRFEGKGLYIATLKPVAESIGYGIAEGVVLPEHYSLKIKATKGFKYAFRSLFNKPVTG